jgi:predicted nucleic acid-binding Zn ribbon protein
LTARRESHKLAFVGVSRGLSRRLAHFGGAVRMPVYEYEHDGGEQDCKLGWRFEIKQPITDDALKACPACGKPVHRIMPRIYISTPRTDSDLKSMGFAKLVRRDEGVYENVTALDGESKVMEAGKPETLPDIKRRIRD